MTSTSTATLYGSVSVSSNVVDRAGADAADLQVAALDEAERVVELDPVPLALRLLGRAREHHGARPAAARTTRS